MAIHSTRLRTGTTEYTHTADTLRTIYPPGSWVTTIRLKTNRTADTHWVMVLAPVPTTRSLGGIERTSYLIAHLGIGRIDTDRQAVVIRGAQMDPAHDIVHSLGRALYGDGRALNHNAL